MRALRAVAIGLLLLGAAACRRAGAPGVRIDPALATLIPPGTRILAGARMDEIRKTPVYERFFAQRLSQPLDQFARDTGLDPRKDLWEFLIVSSGSEAVFLGRGKFAEGGLEPRLNRAGARRTPYKNYTLIGDDRIAVVFVNATTALAGRPGALRSTLDQRDESRGVPATLEEKLRSLPPRSHFWAVAAGGLSSLELPIPSTGNLANLDRLKQSIESAALSLDLSLGADLSVSGACATEADAKRLYDTLRGLIGIARLSTPSDRAELLRLLDMVRVTQAARQVDLKVSVPMDLIESLESLLRPRA